MAVLEIKNLDKFYELGNKTRFQALKNINLSFDKGELVSIVGESGSGKSTLMNVIGGLDSNFEGEISVDGENIKNFSDKELDEYRKKKIGFVFQSFNLIPHLTVLDNVTIALTLANVGESEKVTRATEILTRLGLVDQIKKKPTQLSGGQKQRVAIARALVNDPEIILADEPTGSLDSETTVQILDILKEIADEGKLVIMVTHSEKVAQISSRVVEITDGQITGDNKRKDYKKGKNAKNLTKNSKKTIKNEKKTNLSLWSALKLSFHNMWASKVKNLLIAFGVSVSLVSLVLMLAFGSGLTDYISGLAENYTDPNFVTITKLYEHERDANGDMGDKANIMKPLPLSADEIENLTGENGLINSYLKDKNIDFAVSNENISYGFNMMTYPTGITIKFPINEKGIYDENGEKFKTDQVVYIYTTPPYYDDHNMLAGNISGKNEVMLSKALAKTLGITDYDDIVGKVKLNTLLSFTVDKETTNLDTKDAISDKLTGDPVVSGIVDVTDLLQTMLVMYVDYGYLQDLIDFANAKNSTHLELPTYSIYIETGNEKITNEIKSFINKTDIYTATTVEEQMASMFKGMISVFSTALAVIAGISLIVAAIMILVSLYMSVTERTREIGVLKSIGARRKDIKRIFTSESFLVGVLSGVVGILLALVAYFVLYVVLGSLLGVAPLSLRWWYFALAIGISILISMISGLLPAAKAAKLDPVESLRHE